MAIHIGREEGGRLQSVSSVRARAGSGLEGDRHFRALGAAAGDALSHRGGSSSDRSACRPAPRATRRQLTVRGVCLNDLIGAHFVVGEVECYGVDRCEPCLHLQNVTRPGLIKDLVHRSGLRADILSDGIITVGDPVHHAGER